MKKVAVGISGGVDSAVAALLLKKAGFDVTGVHLYCWPPKSEIEKDGLTREEWIKKNGCRADEDRSFALKTALELEIPFKVLDFSEEYNQKVIKYFYDEYEAGRTPNPDVMCNSEIKFGLFLKWALEEGYDYIATGHYAKLIGGEDTPFEHIPLLATGNPASPAEAGHLDSRLEFFPSENPSNSSLRNVAQRKDAQRSELHLMIPADKHKDQTYFLWKLTQKELEHTLFPLGDLEKGEIRKLAEEYKLSVAKRKDSQGICFVGNVEAREFLARRLKENPGKVLDIHGEEIGKHDGVWFYTIGQRGGWEITPSAQKKFADNGVTPVFYVIKKDAKTNTLVVGEASEAEENHFEISEVNWINETNEKNLLVRIRHGGELISARVERVDDKLRVVLEKSIRGVASGQSAVFYSKKGECFGGGVIV
ncbi:MAG TPA: tRNA 2-thiouridine(34) synthase MnmA [Candidatus Woesebacteria bacterium]|nr:tRNA 2-thiouridine(34) synthase MnmA [Candidatus Woesebacteria bacterium]